MKKVLFYLTIIILVSTNLSFADMLIIGNKNISENSLSKKELQEIFLGKRVKWPDGSRIRFVTLKAHTLHEAFLKQHINRSYSQWKAYWKRMVFTGRGTPPKEFDSTEQLLDYISKTDSAIGYMESDTDPIGVKVFKIN